MHVIVDGKKLATKLEASIGGEIRERGLTLSVVYVGDNPISLRYINMKKKMGARLGISVELHVFKTAITEADLMQEIVRIVADKNVDGVLVQMPLPQHISTEKIVSGISPEKDVDALGEHPLVFPPVVGAIREICKEYAVSMNGKHVVVIGKGKLVGKPVAEWARKEGAFVEVVDRSTKNPEMIFKKADVLISGAGVPSLITPEKIKSGVILFDAATSEMSGKLVGDIDPACANKAALYTPVPGGIGPLTVVLLFKNLLELAERA